MKRITRVLTAGVTRGSSRFTEVQESHKASGGIYEGGGKAKGVARGGGIGERGGRREADWDAADALLKEANLEKGHIHKASKCESIPSRVWESHNMYSCKDAKNLHSHTEEHTAAINNMLGCVWR